jgi:hypothetical protein
LLLGLRRRTEFADEPLGNEWVRPGKCSWNVPQRHLGIIADFR